MIKDFLLRPYGLLGFKRFRWLFSLVGSTFTFFYLIGMKPLGFNFFHTDEQIRLAFYYSVPTAIIWLVHVFLLQPLIFKQMRILNTFVWLAWIHFVIGMYIYTFTEIYIFDSQFDWYFLPETLNKTFQLGGMITAILVIAHYGMHVRRKALSEREYKV